MKYCYNRFLGLPKSSTISGTTRAPIFYKIYEPITSYMWDEFFPSPVYMRFQRDLISFMEIHEIGLHITIPSFISSPFVWGRFFCHGQRPLPRRLFMLPRIFLTIKKPDVSMLPQKLEKLNILLFTFFWKVVWYEHRICIFLCNLIFSVLFFLQKQNTTRGFSTALPHLMKTKIQHLLGGTLFAKTFTKKSFNSDLSCSY